jgi:hypothetical protein
MSGVDFSRNAGVYDNRHGAFIADDLARRLTSESGLPAGSTALDIGECSYVWSVPPDVQRTCLPRLRAWAAERFDLERDVPAPRELKMGHLRLADRMTWNRLRG